MIRVWQDGTRGLTVYDGYGQTETVNLVANYRCVPVRPGSMGKPTPGFDVQVVHEEGERVKDGEEGHIAVRVAPDRPVGLFGGYYLDDEATAAAFHGGWYLTGDKGRCDEDGYLWFESSDALAKELQEHVKRITAPYKYPRLVYFVDELPKTVSGEIRRTELRDRLRRGEPE